MSKTIDYSSAEITNNRNRTLLTVGIFISGILLIALLAFKIIGLANPTERFESAKWVFNALIPLIASWIGTVLAFHFGRENYESATKQALALTKETLKEINVENIMISVKTIVYRKIDPADDDKSTLDSLIELYKNIDKDRIPIFTSSLHPRLMIHRSTMIDYIASKKGTKPDINLKDMLADNTKKFSFETQEGFVVISKSNTIEEALSKMNSVKGCQDVFITSDGKEKSEVIGWLTNTLINRFLTTQ